MLPMIARFISFMELSPSANFAPPTPPAIRTIFLEDLVILFMLVTLFLLLKVRTINSAKVKCKHLIEFLNSGLKKRILR